jgi:hypothetical protein
MLARLYRFVYKNSTIDTPKCHLASRATLDLVTASYSGLNTFNTVRL